VRKADNLPPSCAVVTKSGNLNFLEPSGPVTGLLYLYLSLTRRTVQRRKFQLNVMQVEREIIVRNELSINNGYRSDELICVVRLRKEHSISYEIVKSNRKRTVWLEDNWDNSVNMATRLHDG